MQCSVVCDYTEENKEDRNLAISAYQTMHLCNYLNEEQSRKIYM